MVRWLKEGRSVEAVKADGARVRETVERMLGDIEAEGLEAVRKCVSLLQMQECKSRTLT